MKRGSSDFQAAIIGRCGEKRSDSTLTLCVNLALTIDF
jgi:hypothetical protein